MPGFAAVAAAVAAVAVVAVVEAADHEGQQCFPAWKRLVERNERRRAVVFRGERRLMAQTVAKGVVEKVSSRSQPVIQHP